VAGEMASAGDGWVNGCLDVAQAGLKMGIRLLSLCSSGGEAVLFFTLGMYFIKVKPEVII